MDKIAGYENNGSHILITFEDASGFIAQTKLPWDECAKLQDLLTASLDEHINDAQI
jgi:hypothetical protein